MEKLAAGDPHHIGAYRLLARLGAGGMGHVYLARSDRGRTVAVKLVRAELAAREEFRERFRQEVRAARRVGGYWTAPVLDADTEAAVPWVATGYVAGPSLQQVVGRDHGALPERSVRILAAGLAHALEDIHAAGIVHRDLKPSNVLVTIDGPRVIDFGIARALRTVPDTGLTRTGALVGSPGFMAPEQVRGDRVGPACDVFCLGSVLAYAATGTLPFGNADSSVHALMFRIAQEEPRLDGVPESLADLVRACLRKDPAARPTLDAVLELTGAQDTVCDGRALDPWLPGALVAQLGRHAVRLLETENPEGPGAAGAPGAEPAGPAGSAGPAPTQRTTPGPRPGPVPGPAPRTTEPHLEHLPGGFDAPTTHLPAPVAGQLPPPPPAPGYDHHPHAHPWPEAPAPAPHHPSLCPGPDDGGFGPPPPPPGTPPIPPGRGRSTVLLVLVALVVALAAGGSVYALMSGGGDGDRADGDPTGSPTTHATAPTTPGPSPTSAHTTGQAARDGAVPAGYLGTWTATIDNASGTHTRSLTIQQGDVGDTVLSLVADGADYHCVFAAPLTADPGTDGPLRIGPSEVRSGEPATSCTPGAPTEVTLLPDGRLRRVNAESGEHVTYTRR
ncbi:serine/threonine-protein kinase [Streptomyces sp. NPDC005876]|uniref:serine/threonine-protein kinase n=1 Tax=Streptomyces sp. NPDC005876 TaxID=3157076 RepID=UPI003400831E